MRTLVLGALTAVAIAGGPGIARADRVDPRWDLVKRAIEASQRDDCREAQRLVKPLLAPGATDGLPEEFTAAPHHVAAMCYARTGDLAQARRMALAGTALPGALDQFWHFRLGYDLYAQDYAAAVTTMTEMARSRPRALNTMPIRIIYQLNQALREAKSEELRVRFLEIVTAASYVPDQPGASKDWFRQALAEKLVAKGDRAGAAALVGRIERTQILLELSFDPRFRGMIAADFDPRAAAERELARAGAEMERYPMALAPLTDAAESLRLLGKPKEALDVLETARANGKKVTDYSDADDRASWWWDSLGETHEMMGNAAAMTAAYRQGSATKEDGMANVSQVLNLSHAQVRFGHYAEALKTLPSANVEFSVSPYGAVTMRVARGCANAGLGNLKAVAPDLAYIRAHQKDSWKALPHLLLCSGDMDGAAAARVALLGNDEHRVKTLLWLSDYDPPLPGRPLSVADKRLDELKQRADIKAAIEKAGGIRRIRLQRS